MENTVLGIHHISAIASNAKGNYDFYTKVLGLRFIKKTVNFDDPNTYHFYFGDKVGTPGTILTFFPWQGVARGKQGTGMPTEIGYSVAEKSLSFWTEHFQKNGVKITGTGTRFNEAFLSFEDPDGLPLALIIPTSGDTRQPWATKEVTGEVATKGFHSISLTLKSVAATAEILTDVFEYKFVGKEGNRHRYRTDAIPTAAVVDLIEAPDDPRAVNAGGTIHHVAFRVKDEEVLMAFREKVLAKGLNITQKVDRNYFFSLYFREPGGVLFELATDNPGFSVDESVEELGQNLKLPAQYEKQRSQIEAVLPVLN
jgi:glyoxalase family protein